MKPSAVQTFNNEIASNKGSIGQKNYYANFWYS